MSENRSAMMQEQVLRAAGASSRKSDLVFALAAQPCYRAHFATAFLQAFRSRPEWGLAGLIACEHSKAMPSDRVAHMGISTGQNETTRGAQVLVHVSIDQGSILGNYF